MEPGVLEPRVDITNMVLPENTLELDVHRCAQSNSSFSDKN